MKDAMTIAGGIGGLIVLLLVLKNASAFGTITNSIASSSVDLISVLQGNRPSGIGSLT